MRGRNRDQLHQNKLDEFVEWACEQGWTSEPTKGVFEVLRLRNGKRLALGYQRGGCDHVTVYGESATLVKEWMRQRGRHAAAWRL